MSARARHCSLALLAWWIGTVCSPLPLRADSDAAPLAQAVLRIGLPRVAFGNLNENDATAAYRVFLKASGRKRGYDLVPEVSVYDTLPQLERAIRSGLIHVVVLNSWQLLTAKLSDAVDVEFVPIVGGDPLNRVLLVVRRDGGARPLANLRGESVLILRNANATLGRPWLETSCLAAGFGFPDSFFGRVEFVGKPNAAILPVFFGRYGACVVDERSFAVACELNPQLRRELVVLAQSEPMLEGLVCLNRIGWETPRHRADLAASLGELHLEPTGRQILTLFHIERLAPYRPDTLQSVAALEALHAQLLSRLAAGASP